MDVGRHAKKEGETERPHVAYETQGRVLQNPLKKGKRQGAVQLPAEARQVVHAMPETLRSIRLESP